MLLIKASPIREPAMAARWRRTPPPGVTLRAVRAPEASSQPRSATALKAIEAANQLAGNEEYVVLAPFPVSDQSVI